MGKRMSAEVERVCKVFETLMEDYKKRFSDFEKGYVVDNEENMRHSRKNLSYDQEMVVQEHV